MLCVYHYKLFPKQIPASLLPFSYKSVSEDRGFFLLNFSCYNKIILKI
jgi:hypothetical protein